MADGSPPPITHPQGKDRPWQRWAALKSERASWDPHAKELSVNILPRNSRFFVEDRNRGGNRYNQIYDNTGTLSLRVLAAGMMAGMTSPARPWFRLKTADDLMRHDSVKVWLAEVQSLMLSIFAQSNTYRALHSAYEELGCFGTHVNLVMPDFDNVIHLVPLTWGEYCIATNWKGEVDTVYREFQKTVSSIVDEFGWDNVSDTVKNLYRQNQLDSWITVVHAIEPRRDRDSSKLDTRNMPWKSVYFELEGRKDKYLRESGFKSFPGLAPRWAVTGSDEYGHSPGMECLGDIKQLKHEQLRKGQGIDYQTKPPLQAPTAMRGQEFDLLPGGVSFADAANPTGGIRTAFETRLDLNYLLQDIVDVRERIRSGFYADLFLMLSQNETGTMTATEVAERHEEKLLMLGPVLERLQNELLSPLVNITFDRIMELGIAPPPPPEIEGMNVDVEFVSMLAQAQRAVQINGVDRWLVGVGSLINLGKTEAGDKINTDELVDEYADMLGVPPSVVTPDDQVAAIRQARAAEAARQQEAARNADLAKAAGELGRVPTQGGGSNLALDAIDMFSGYRSDVAQ